MTGVPAGAAGTLISGCQVATVDELDTDYADGYVAFASGRITAVGARTPPQELARWDRLEGSGLLVTPNWSTPGPRLDPPRPATPANTTHGSTRHHHPGGS